MCDKATTTAAAAAAHARWCACVGGGRVCVWLLSNYTRDDVTQEKVQPDDHHEVPAVHDSHHHQVGVFLGGPRVAVERIQDIGELW